ncbi:MAG: glycosyltransferase [Nodosilinea sp.]
MAVPTITKDGDGPLIYPPVSVIVPVYNGEADLPALVERLLAQTYPADRVDYWLVDNGSGDRTPHLLQAAVVAAKNQGVRCHTLAYSAVQSSYAARNAGIRAAKGEILAFTDADCQPQPTWLTALVQPFGDEGVGLVAGEINALPSRHWLERYADRQGTLSQANTLGHRYLPYGQTANLAVRASIFRQVGLFRPHLTTGGDADICWRIQQETDWAMVYAQDAVVYHRHRQSLGELQRQWQRYGSSNRYLHELHGTALTRQLTPGETRYRLLRWVGKELPLATAKLLTGQGTAVDLVVTPLDLWCAQARSRGQQEAHLSESARQIDYLGEES